jgi:hypothetical protein
MEKATIKVASKGELHSLKKFEEVCQEFWLSEW